MFLGGSNKSKLNFFRLSRVQQREKRIAPGLVLPEYQIEPNTEVRDLLATAAFDTQRSWSWIKDYRRAMLGGARYTSELPPFLQSEEWTHMAHDQIVKKRIEDLVHTAYNPKPKPKVQKVELSAEAKAKAKAKSQQKAKKPAGKPKK